VRSDAVARAATLGTTIQTGGYELLEYLEPLWLSMYDHHLAVGAAGFPVISRADSWPLRRRLYQELLTKDDTIIVLSRRHGIPVGYCLAHVHDGADDTWPTGDRIGEIESLCVLAEERGRGLGTILLDVAEDHLSSAGADTVMLGVVVGNTSALNFYARRGMRPAMTKLMRLGPDRQRPI
jgi:ribosomal protein S18 acetylase RimI-like enzyme